MALIDTGSGDHVGRLVLDREGRRLGKLERTYGEEGRPRWGAVKPGRFGRSRMVPLGDARAEGDEIRLAATKQQVKDAPRAPRDAGLSPKLEDQLRGHYREPATAPPGRRRRMAVPRSRGAASGVLLLILGLWGGLSPLVGPLFGYGFGQDDAWRTTTDMLWLSFLPAAAVVVGALVLLISANRAGAAMGAWVALVGGIWFAVGPAFSLLWDAGGPDAPIGRPLGDEGLRVTELIWSFYGLGVLTAAVAAFAFGRLATVSVRDVEAARRHERS